MDSGGKPARVQWRDGARYLGCAVTDSPIVIGGRDGDVRVPGATVSRRQARIFRQEGTVWIEDLGGDGVWVNGVKVDRVQLANRDKLQVGALDLRFWEG
jgi:pSer/pThr/pTyr-binding forkhead associated (FHA) protein